MPDFEWKDLFAAAEARARRTDPSTSHAAAASLSDDELSRLQKLVIECLRSRPDGLTVPEIAVLVDIPRDTISPRIKPLVERRLIVNSAQKRIPPGHTRQCIVWRLA